jgi:hypothetical protein
MTQRVVLTPLGFCSRSPSPGTEFVVCQDGAGVLSSTSVGQGVCLPPTDNSPDICKTSTVIASAPAGAPASTVAESNGIPQTGFQTGFLATTTGEQSQGSTYTQPLRGSTTHTQLFQASIASTGPLQASSTGNTTSNPPAAARVSPGGIAGLSFGAIAVATIAFGAYFGMRQRQRYFHIASISVLI